MSYGGLMAKRTVQVNVKMSEEDFALLKRAAAAHWPDAVITNSGIVLGLAKNRGQDCFGGEQASIN